MTAYPIPRSIPISHDVAAKKAARKKVVEKAQQLERKCYFALMRKKRLLQANSEML